MKYGPGAKGLVLKMVYLHAQFCYNKRPKFRKVQGEEKISWFMIALKNDILHLFEQNSIYLLNFENITQMWPFLLLMKVHGKDVFTMQNRSKN